MECRTCGHPMQRRSEPLVRTASTTEWIRRWECTNGECGRQEQLETERPARNPQTLVRHHRNYDRIDEGFALNAQSA